MSNPGVTDTTDVSRSLSVKVSHQCIEQFLALFSSVTLYGLTSLDDDDSKERSITLIREQSFPAKRYSADEEGRAPVHEQRWDAISPPVDGLHADLQITDQLGEGRMGQVFAARLVGLKKSIHGETLPDGYIPLPSQFCIKLAKPEYIRSLAREAWFYEQLSKEGYLGAITPVCFGFFACRLPDNVQVLSWSSIKIKPEKPEDVPEGEEPNYDLLVDDEEGWYCYFDDGRRSHLDSTWHLQQWKARTDRSLLSVGILITERLGKHMPATFSTPRKELVRGLPQEVRTEMLTLLEDLNVVGIVHGDIKFDNVLNRASESWSSCEVCPRHKRVHPWRLIDFDRAGKYDPVNPVDSSFVSNVQNCAVNYMSR
ncbi:hypothetical protein DFJ43DRAFT_863072 [Lentinula guzmanii]|uniref:Protein kinase domain-containing protein n=1 Tax=Lentinula guzmanii TaxID=2804957 RepID=A0AA38JRT1_9AGAR|nr:hypothetical protein DFJ43DRAFT_863072 [Lentinula guzmanii]